MTTVIRSFKMTVVINFVQGLLRDRITAILHRLIVDDGRHHVLVKMAVMTAVINPD